MRRRLLLDDGMVLSQKTKPVLVAETSEQDRGVDDVGENDRHGSIRSEDSCKVWLLELEVAFELFDARRLRPSEKLDVRFRQ